LLVAIFGLLAAFVAAGMLVGSVVLLINGIAGGLGELLGRAWLGNLATGLGLLLITALAAYIVVRRITRTSRERTVTRYRELREDVARQEAKLHDRPRSEEQVRV
jgi:membrane protein implicated in regulation of membrane protease activity